MSYSTLESPTSRRLLEIIAVGDSADPVADARQELIAHGFWAPDASASGALPKGASTVSPARQEAEPNGKDL